MHLLLVVLHALCELIGDLGLAARLEPARLPVDEPEGSPQADIVRVEPSRCNSNLAASRFSRRIPRPLSGFGKPARWPLHGQEPARWRRRL